MMWAGARQKEDNQLPNVIFLDMDGVLCTPRACIAVGNNGLYSYLDPIACLLVKKLCEEYNADLVISSMWRHHYNKESMTAILNASCPMLGEYVWKNSTYWKTHECLSDETYDENTSDRGREISKWISDNTKKFNNFVILDDMADMRPLQSSLVKCDTYDGIGFHQYRQAAQILSALPE